MVYKIIFTLIFGKLFVFVDFCKQGIFSLTVDYNNGALPCQCDFQGARSFECEPFGGQCACKDNVIGRRCERCKTGFFGFPNCKPCDCPSTSLCDEVTGKIIEIENDEPQLLYVSYCTVWNRRPLQPMRRWFC